MVIVGRLLSSGMYVSYSLVEVQRLLGERAVSIFTVEGMVTKTAITSKQKGDCAE
jgi:hypothetical protein